MTTIKSNLLLLNENPKRLNLFHQAPLFYWENAEYKFLAKRRTITEYFCKTKQPLVNSLIELLPISVELLYGELFTILCSGIDVGFCFKLSTQYKVKVLGESLMITHKLIQSDKDKIEVLLSLPTLQVHVRDNTTQFIIVKNPSLIALE